MSECRFKAVGTSLIADIDAVNAGTLRYIGRKFDKQLRGYVPIDDYPAVKFHPEYLEAIRSGDLLPADEATANKCGVSFNPKR